MFRLRLPLSVVKRKCFISVLILCFLFLLILTLAGSRKVSKNLENNFHLTGTKTFTTRGDDRCIILSCFDKQAQGSQLFLNYYRQFGYTVRQIQFQNISFAGKRAVPAWCRVPTVIDALSDYQNSRIIYIDIDTRINPDIWCNLPDIREHAPIIMNSLYRRKALNVKGRYSVFGSQVQANVFIVTYGKIGIKAMKRWRSMFQVIRNHDQGVIHVQEKGLCGVPGWISCYRNPMQQSCHCAGLRGKEKCIRKLFNKTKIGCTEISSAYVPS